MVSTMQAQIRRQPTKLRPDRAPASGDGHADDVSISAVISMLKRDDSNDDDDDKIKTNVRDNEGNTYDNSSNNNPNNNKHSFSYRF